MKISQVYCIVVVWDIYVLGLLGKRKVVHPVHNSIISLRNNPSAVQGDFRELTKTYRDENRIWMQGSRHTTLPNRRNLYVQWHFSLCFNMALQLCTYTLNSNSIIRIFGLLYYVSTNQTVIHAWGGPKTVRLGIVFFIIILCYGITLK